MDRQELVLFSSERESWAQERNRLEKSLRQAEAELTRLRADIRSDTLRDLTGADLDNTALKVRPAALYKPICHFMIQRGAQMCT